MSSALPLPSGAEAPERQLTTKEGWRDFVGQVPKIPARLSRSEWRQLPAAERERYDEDRLDHHTRMLVIATSAIEHTIIVGSRLVLLNRHAISARRGLIVSGLAGTGKTTAITQLGLRHELTDRKRHPGITDRIPVVYITVPPAATARMVAAEFARFLGLPVRTRSNITDLIEAVVGVLTDTRCGLVLVDELHNISLTTRQGAEVSDTLKYFSERIPVTFVYAGIDVEKEGMFAGTRGGQIAGRFTLIPTHPFPYGTEWKGLVAQLEDTLCLLDHQAGTLRRLDRYLHTRTGGMIGALSHQIRGAAIDAILTGTEKLTRAGLDRVPLDYTAQQHDKPLSKKRRR
ncbi:AAA family ATPase [Streptomyces sp. A7024]|uniref:AAA family ATPase n=1 Tax=Streptomyces coryli TaxID=1128680 RepID=A0A6G4TVV5_9ACTN|nr:TniB family NTP-binding protein [Streptomyces coryli]NGN63177.1 AAA family ATPase [Streptomyces coryli]